MDALTPIPVVQTSFFSPRAAASWQPGWDFNLPYCYRRQQQDDNAALLSLIF
jgi:hypothetical protein